MEKWLFIKQKKCLYYSLIVTTISFTLGYLILSVYLGIFAYANPDPDHCYYIIGLDQVASNTSVVKLIALAKGIHV